ncbi:hypothetical protein OAN15_01870 [bacterium]|nr:hypothetical protein [bacterium]
MDQKEKLTPADEAHLRFLRGQVDRLTDISFRKDAPDGIRNQLFHAREELRKFVEGKRRQGYNI